MATRYAMGGTTIESRPKKLVKDARREPNYPQLLEMQRKKAYRGQGK